MFTKLVMGVFGFAKDTLAQMRLSQLRELARRLGVARYSSMLRDQLVSAIQSRSARATDSDVPLSPASALEASPEPVTIAATNVVVAEPLPPASSPSPAPTASPTSAPAPASSPIPSAAIAQSVTPAWIALIPQEPQWAIVRWQIAAEEHDRAVAAGGRQLALRLTDVTHHQGSDSLPQAFQEVVVDAGATEWHLPVPLGDRDYRVELGYRTATGGWHSLVLSAAARMPAEITLPCPEAFQPFSLQDSTVELAGFNLPNSPGLHERLYQRASAARPGMSQGSEGFHDQAAREHGAAAAGGHWSGVGPWASGREASGAGMAARQRSFWLVADAELIVYGATDPAAALTVGNQPLALDQDGTFSLHTTFPDGEQSYPIRAVAADGEQQRSITLDFRRSTPHAHVNAKEAATAEWF